MDDLTKSSVFNELAEAAGSLSNPTIESFKEQGGKVMGYFCSSMPQELLTAAGMLAFRMRATGSSGTELADAFFSSINCSFPRHCMNEALNGNFDFLNGLIVPNSCDNVRRVYDHWIRQMKTPFVKMVSLPRKAGEQQVKWFQDELTNLKDEMETHFNIKISDDNIRQAIKQRNETGKLLRKLYDLKKSDNPPITGAQTLAVTVAGTAMPKDHYNRLLNALLKELNKMDSKNDYRARLMIMGGELDNPEYLKVIEDQGGLVVTDSLCFGTKMFWNDVDESIADPVEALAQYYVAEHPSCPRVFGQYENRADFIRNMINNFNVDGVILERLAFCEVWGFEPFTIKNDFEEWKIPLLIMDREYTLSSVGQLRTRTQAFIETIGR